MKIILKQDIKVLKTITLTTLQQKALKLMSQEPVEYLTYKIERILEFTVEQAKQTFASRELENATDSELEIMADEIEAEKLVKEEETVPT